jgi:microcystin-dependent protein
MDLLPFVETKINHYGNAIISGTSTTALTVAQMPAHIHPAHAYTAAGSTPSSTGNLMADTSGSATATPDADKDYNLAAPGTLVAMGATAVGMTGKGAPFSITQANTAVNFIIAVEGIYPTRP